MAKGEIVIYSTADDPAHIPLHAIDGSVWLSQAEIAELFATSAQNITLHIKSIYEDSELQREATCKDYLQVRTEGERQVERQLKHYNLEMLLAIGYRVRSVRGIQFRQWATSTLKEYLIKGFVMNDERLKAPKIWDYFDEMLERIRDIRASEKRFVTAQVLRFFVILGRYAVPSRGSFFWFHGSSELASLIQGWGGT